MFESLGGIYGAGARAEGEIMTQSKLDRWKEREKELVKELEILRKAIEIVEKNTDWFFILEAMNH